MGVMSVESWIAITTGEIALIGAAAAGIKYLVKKYLSELKPNGGTSIHDKINKEVVPMLKELVEKVAKLEGRFEQHIDETKE